MKKLVIIPAYNEEENIVRTVTAIKEQASGFDYVVINDCSTDRTLQICREEHLNVIDLPINLGIGGAVQTGFKYALANDYDIAVQVDGDGQHNPRYLNKMLAVIEDGSADMVIGSRFIEKEGFQSSPLRRLGISYFTRLIRLLTGVRITDPTSGLRMVNRRGIQLFAESYPDDYPEPESIITVLRRKFRVRETAVVMNERRGGVSSISPLKSIYYMIKVTLAMIIAAIKKGAGKVDDI